MVRTRHSGDLEETESPKFMSLDNERERFRPKKEFAIDGTRSRPRGAYHDDDDEFEMFEEESVVETRLRPRTGPGRAYNYLDADSSDDDQRRRRKIHSPHKELRNSRSIKEDMIEETSRRSRRLSSRLSPPPTDTQEDAYPLRRSQRERSHQIVEDDNYRQNTRSGRHSQLTEQDGGDDGDSDNDEQDEEETEGEDEEDDDAKDGEDTDNEEEGGTNEFSDMYSRVKRKRVRRSLNIYDDDAQQNRNNNQRDDSEDEEPGSIRRSKRIFKKREIPQIVKSYSLREHKPRTDLYKAPVEERRIKKASSSMFEVTPTKKTDRQTYQSPALRKKSRKRSAAMHSSSSSTSSSGGESSDEKSFRKRKAKSMAKARSRMMPMNFNNAEPTSTVIKDRVKSGASLADVEPMNIDKNVTFDSIGGLGKHIRALKEMVVFPLLYDKVFQRFNVDPPRGVLFYGPPGTGKTLVARALANECSQGDKKVAFFMRKGADCLSKWVGESERQLRLLFDQAYKYRPSIIFFDEIDGLAPVRSSRQDQIHSSIVSTLLALMDGLDSRGEIVVIGATNRIDSLDPALRRPGRFDREFLFPLPTLEARSQILKIQTSSWNPKLNERFITELAEKCVGYCGADLKSLCTEAAMLALRRRYPQIYISNEALQLDESSIQVCAKDFFDAVNNIIPTSRRSVNNPGRPLILHILPLLERQLTTAINRVCDTFPPCLMKMSSLDAAATNKQAQVSADLMLDDLASDEDEDAPSIFVTPSNKASRIQPRKSLEGPSCSKTVDSYLNFTSYSTHQPTTFRPRVLLTGFPGQGQTSYIAPALIHKMEDLPVHVLDLPALYAVTAKTPEESCANVFHEARRKCPSIIYMPYINQWWDVLGDTLRTTLLTLIQDLNPTTPLLLLATSEQPYASLDVQLQYLFSQMSGEVVKMTNPNAEERRNFFKELLLQHSAKAPPQKKNAEQIINLLEQTQKSKFLPCSLNKVSKSQHMMHFTEHNENLFHATDSELLCRKAKCPPTRIYKSKHRMKLRSRRTIRGCNNNHIGKLYESHSSNTCDQLNYSCTDVARVKSLTRLRQRFGTTRSNPSSQEHVTNSKSCVNTNCSNNGLTERHVRYLRRMNKTLFCEPSCSRTFSSCQSRTCLSSGSVQMLYKKNDVNPCAHSVNDPILPINFTHLRRNGIRHSKSASCQYNLRSKAKRLLLKYRYKQRINDSAKRMLEKLPKAAPVKPNELTKQEMSTLLEKEELTLMELRIFLREVLHKLGSDKKFSIFTKPVNIENAPDYYEVIANPMDMSTMMSRIDCHEYGTVRSFMDDIDLICSNALEYNPDRGPMDKVIRHRACALKDTAYAIIKTELDKEFEKSCVDIQESRKRRGAKSTTVPNFYRTKPPAAQNVGEPSSSRNSAIIPSYLDSNRPARSIPQPDGERFSRRVRGIEIDPTPTLEDIERKSKSSSQVSKTEDDHNDGATQSSSQASNIIEEDESMLSQEMNSDNESTKEDSISLPKSYHTNAQTDPLHKRARRQKCVWCKPSRKRRRKIFKDSVHFARRKMVQTPAKIGKEEKKSESKQSPSVNQPLKVDVVCESTDTELKSPDRKITRIVSPPGSNLLGGVTTRRQSLSPRASRPSVETKLKDLPQGENAPIQESSASEDKEETPAEEGGVDKSRTEESVLGDDGGKDKAEQTESAAVPEILGKKLENLKSTESQEVKKPSVVKNLDLDLVDSGAGSSLDGNGDSRDSMDNKLEDIQPSTSSHLSKDFNQNNKQDASHTDSAIAMETPNKLVVPTQRLVHLLDQLVLSSEGFNVERLEKIYSQLSQTIFKHRQSYNRSDMVNELEKKVIEMTQRLPSLSSSR